MRKLPFVFLLASLSLHAFALPGPTSASFAKGAVFTVSGYAGQSPLSGFPVLVRLAAGSPSGFSYADLHSPSNGADLAFVDMLGAGLPFEIDTWDTNGTSLVWVRLPSMSSGTQFVMCYGSDSSGKAVCPDNPWSGYTGVWHMNETPAGVTTIHDSTANGLDGTTVATSDTKADGVVGRARFITSNTVNTAGNPYDSGVTIDLSGAANSNKLAAVDAIVPEFTASFWVRPQNNAQWWYFITRKASDPGPGWGLQNGSEGNNASFKVFRAYGGTENDGNCMNLTGVNALSKGTWTKIDAVWMSDKTFKLYVNGVFAKQGTLVNQASNGNQTKLALGGAMGPTSSAKNGRGVYGDMDEIRLRAGVPEEDRIAADYATQNDPASFLTASAVEEYVESDDPLAAVSVSSFAYTNATLLATIADLGGGAASADVLVQLAADAGFASPLWSTNYAVSGPGAQSFAVAGLAFGTTYWARLSVTNALGGSVEAGPVTFATPAPGAPSGTATFLERGFTTLSASGAATAYGTGAQSATMRLEASADGFTNIVASLEFPAVAGAAETPLAVSNLVPATAYAMRLRIRNDWGLDTFVALQDAAMRDVPFATTGIGWTFSSDGSTADVTFGVSGIYDGATGSATLYYGASPNPTESKGSRFVSGSGDLAWTNLPVSAATMYAKVVLSATLAGTTYTQTYTARLTAGSASVAVSDVTEHMSAATAVRVRPGDVVTLPELSGTARYILGNALFGSLDGNVLTALRPGILGIHCVGNDGATNTMAVLVLPERIGGGNIYVYKEKSVSNHSCNWTEPQRWEKIGSDTNESFPNGANDIAIIPYYDENSVQFNLPADVVLAALYAGRWQDAAGNVSIRSLSSPTHGIAFERADGEPARIQLCPNAPLSGDNAFRVRLTIADTIPSIAFHTDTTISGGSDRPDASYPQGRFEFNALLFDISEGATVSLVEMDTWETGAAIATMGGGRLTGAGTFWNRSAAAIRFARNKTSFTGLLRDSGGYGHQSADRCGPTEIRSNSTNATVETVGWVSVNASAQPNTWWKAGVGCVVIGHDHGHNAPPAHLGTNWFPRVATLHGGWLQVLPLQTVWGAPGVLDRKYARRLVVADGFSYFRGYSRDTSGGYPVNWFEADELGHENKATLRIDDDSRKSTASTATITNQATFLRGWASAAVGPAGDPESSDAYPTVPWIVSPLDGGNDKIYFSAFDSDGRLVRPALAANNTALSSFSAGRNAYCRNAGIALTEDLTVNSLYLQNDTKGKTLGAGRTLTVTSGGLILSDVNDNSNPGSAAIGEEGGSENGALVLGDADHPAYVWAYGATTSSANTAPNQIWAPVTAPGGFVAAYTGHLVLGGDQTGIGDELVVNAGTLQLGSTDRACTLAKNLPIRIFANATLKLPNADSTGGKLIQFDGAAGWFGKVEIADGVAAQVKKAFVRDYPESPEWETLPRGFYGSSESGVEALATVTHPAFVRDDLFSGTGTLKVVADDRIPPTLMILR